MPKTNTKKPVFRPYWFRRYNLHPQFYAKRKASRTYIKLVSFINIPFVLFILQTFKCQPKCQKQSVQAYFEWFFVDYSPKCNPFVLWPLLPHILSDFAEIFTKGSIKIGKNNFFFNFLKNSNFDRNRIYSKSALLVQL